RVRPLQPAQEHAFTFLVDGHDQESRELIPVRPSQERKTGHSRSRPRRLKGRFVFRDLLVFRLMFVMFGPLTEAALLPAGGICLLFLLAYFLVLRCRLRYACFAFVGANKGYAAS